MARISNKQRIDNFIELLKRCGYKAYNIEYGNGYFLFEFGKDTVAHFKIKGCKGWQFAVWLNTDKEKDYELQFFFQYIKDIDKFKPSASDYCYEITKNDYNDNYKWLPMINGLEMVKKHSSVARNLGLDEWKPKWKCVWDNFYHRDFYEWKGKFLTKIKRNIFFILFIKLNPKIKKYLIVDKNKGQTEWYTYPEFDIHYLPKKKILNNDELYDKLDNKLEEIERKWSLGTCIQGYNSEEEMKKYTERR